MNARLVGKKPPRTPAGVVSAILTGAFLPTSMGLDSYGTRVREQCGHRPVLVLSPLEYNRKTGLALVCPITSRVKGYPFEVRVQEKSGIDGAVLSDHVKNLDWKARNAKYASKVPGDVLQSVRDKLAVLLGG